MSPARLLLGGLRSGRAGPFDLALAPGEALAVTGPSGAGKSLMLRMIADLDPHEGQAWLDGTACRAMRPAAWRRQVAYCAAESGWWHETVGAHFAAIPAAASRLGLRPALFDQPVRDCSTGERQRLALLRALDPEPLVLLLDEPTGPLDPDATAAVESWLAEHLARGAAMVLVTHDERQAERLGTSRRRMEAGQLLPAPA